MEKKVSIFWLKLTLPSAMRYSTPAKPPLTHLRGCWASLSCAEYRASKFEVIIVVKELQSLRVIK